MLREPASLSRPPCRPAFALPPPPPPPALPPPPPPEFPPSPAAMAGVRTHAVPIDRMKAPASKPRWCIASLRRIIVSSWNVLVHSLRTSGPRASLEPVGHSWFLLLRTHMHYAL